MDISRGRAAEKPDDIRNLLGAAVARDSMRDPQFLLRFFQADVQVVAQVVAPGRPAALAALRRALAMKLLQCGVRMS